MVWHKIWYIQDIYGSQIMYPNHFDDPSAHIMSAFKWNVYKNWIHCYEGLYTHSRSPKDELQ